MHYIITFSATVQKMWTLLRYSQLLRWDHVYGMSCRENRAVWLSALWERGKDSLILIACACVK
jgi:hypothetical protein